jgi:hypothetical protein
VVKIRVSEVIASTDKAMLFLHQNREIWIPRSLVSWLGAGWVKIPEWFAERENLNWKPVVPVLIPEEPKIDDVLRDN